MALQFSHAVGYRGYCALAGKAILCTGGSISLTQDPIMGSGVWGAGYANAAPIAYAWNYLNLQGSANFELTRTTGKTGNDSVWGKLKSFAFTDRTSQQQITLYPDGRNGFKGPGWLSSLSFDASQGAALSGSFNFKGDPSGNNIKSSGEGDTSSNGVSNGKVDFAGETLVPYWNTRVTDNGTQLTDVISWSCSYNSDIQMLKCCNNESSAPISADYILLGEMSADGNYTIFRIKNDFDPKSYHQQKTNLTFEIGSGSIQIPLAIVNSGSTSMATGASYITSQFSFTALGDGTKSIMSMSNDI